MMKIENPSAAESSDAELVADTLAGGREAFRQIVERHQTLVCSLAYCATGSFTASEDLAQETFLAAWRQLAELREPSKLRPWLCGIARFVIGKELRRQHHEPIHHAETLDAVDTFAGGGPLPSEHVMSREEEAILWRCVSRIPEIYREPLVLFYREHQSIERVAEALELSEDAVKQQLARGRKMLQEQTLAYVEGALQNTNPSHRFTAGVLAVLPLSVTPAKALALGAAVKGSSSAKTLASFATVGALGALILHWSLLGFLAFAGVCAGFWMSQAAEQSRKQCENAMRFWRAFALTFAICFVARQVLFFRLFGGQGAASHLPWFTMRLVLDSSYLVTVIALALWMARWFREAAIPETKIQDFPRKLKRRLTFWLSLGLVGPVCWFVPIAGGMFWQLFSPPVIRHLSDAEFHRQVDEIVRERNYGWCILMDKDGKKTVKIVRPEHDGSERWTAHLFGRWKRWAGGTKPDGGICGMTAPCRYGGLI